MNNVIIYNSTIEVIDLFKYMFSHMEFSEGYESITDAGYFLGELFDNILKNKYIKELIEKNELNDNNLEMIKNAFRDSLLNYFTYDLNNEAAEDKEFMDSLTEGYLSLMFNQNNNMLVYSGLISLSKFMSDNLHLISFTNADIILKKF